MTGMIPENEIIKAIKEAMERGAVQTIKNGQIVISFNGEGVLTQVDITYTGFRRKKGVMFPSKDNGEGVKL